MKGADAQTGRRALAALLTLLVCASARLRSQEPHPEGPRPPGAQWNMHSWSRPRPPAVDPGPERAPVPPPQDAVVLFDGNNLEQWVSQRDSSPARWIVRDGYMEVAPGAGGIMTRVSFGDVQLHVEWSAPVPPTGESQERGNSGVFLMTRYEVQVLDSYQNETYADGMAGAIYGQSPPLANPARPPGQWNAYDIIFHRPMFGADGEVTRPATVTVFFNGVLVQDNFSLSGGTAHMQLPRYRAHPARLPIALQDHNSRVRFRDIWARELSQ